MLRVLLMLSSITIY